MKYLKCLIVLLLIGGFIGSRKGYKMMKRKVKFIDTESNWETRKRNMWIQAKRRLIWGGIWFAIMITGLSVVVMYDYYQRFGLN